MKGIKRAGCILLVTFFLFSTLFYSAFAENKKVKLSELPDEILFQTMLDLGLIIPKGCDVPEDNLRMIRRFVEVLENDPSAEYPGSMVWYYQLFCRVKSIVFSYYEIDSDPVDSIGGHSRYTLQYSTFFTDGSANQNCYGYVLGQDAFINPGYYAYGYDFTGLELQNFTPYDLACRVKADLQASPFNYQNVTITTTRPSWTYCQTAYCVRKGSDDIYGTYEFHLMKLTYNNIWRHKPGWTDILTYNSLPDNAVYWTSEYATNAFTFYPGSITYDSQIYYIIYSY